MENIYFSRVCKPSHRDNKFQKYTWVQFVDFDKESFVYRLRLNFENVDYEFCL